VEKCELENLFKQVDVITIHMPKTSATTNMINADSLALMKEGVRIVNCARGGLIDEKALADAIAAGKVAASGLDVFEVEPLPEDSALRPHKNVVLTPHLGASTVEAQENVGYEVAECIVDVLESGIIRNAINAPAVDSKQLEVLRPYLDLGYKMGLLVQQMTPDQISKLRIIYSGKLINMDVKPLTRAFQRGYLKRITNDVNDVNAPRVMDRLGIQGEVVQSNVDSDYTDLIRVEAIDDEDVTHSVEGTLIGRSHRPRIVRANGRVVETPLDDKYLLMIENKDVPGIVGMVGSILAEHKLNISNMSLSRTTLGGLALNICGLDDLPPKSALDKIRRNEAIQRLLVIDLTGA